MLQNKRILLSKNNLFRKNRLHQEHKNILTNKLSAVEHLELFIRYIYYIWKGRNK
jgi:hypothetical protein